MRFVWQLTNDADIQWQPNVIPVSDSQLSVTCDTPSMIGYKESTELSCTVLTSQAAEPFTEPNFFLKFSGSGADHTEPFSLYIGGTEEVSWSGLTSNSFNEGESKEIQILVTNSGTLPFNHVITGSADQDWDIEIIGNGIVDLAVGESKTVKFLVTPNTDGFAEITLAFKSVENAESASYTFAANAEQQSLGSAAFGITPIQIGFIP